MGFKADTLRVLVASPSEMAEERLAVVEAIQDWNDQHAASELAVLLPVRWETHSMPQAGARPQGAINRQFVSECDLLIGMFWTRIGTKTGVTESGTVEEIDQFVAAGKPAMLYFSDRPINPSKVDADQLKKLIDFKHETYQTALTGSFSGIDQVRKIVLRDLVRQVRAVHKPRPRRVEKGAGMTDMIVKLASSGVNPDQYRQWREVIAESQRKGTATHDPIPVEEVGPNGCPTGYDDEGNKVEWIEEDGETWGMILRRSDGAINEAHSEFWDKVWYNRHLGWHHEVMDGGGPETLSNSQLEIYERARKGAKRIERKFGKRNLRWTDFEWGLLSGRLSALAWVGGAEWDESLDT